MKRVLIVSPHWLPITAPDMQRIRLSAPFYRENGWEPVILHVRTDDILGVEEHDLAKTVPEDLEEISFRAVSVSVSRRLGMGSLGPRCVLGLWAAGSKVLKQRRFDLVFFSTTQFITLLCGPVWRKSHGVPYVIDIQDPWRSDFYEREGVCPPGGWKYQIAKAVAWGGEQRAFRGASGFISVSSKYLEDLASRYEWFSGKPQREIRFGGSPIDVDMARRLPSPTNREACNSGKIRILYTGAAGPITPHAVDSLFRALRRLADRHPDAARKLEFAFVGTSYARNGDAQPAILPLAEKWGVAGMVTEVPRRIGHLEAIRLQLDSDVLLIMGSRDPAYSPSKIYSYLLSERPLFSAVFAGSALERLLAEAGCPTDVLLGGDSEAEEARFCEVLLEIAEGSRSWLPHRLPERFHARHLTRQQCELFEEALRFEKK